MYRIGFQSALHAVDSGSPWFPAIFGDSNPTWQPLIPRNSFYGCDSLFWAHLIRYVNLSLIPALIYRELAYIFRKRLHYDSNFIFPCLILLLMMVKQLKIEAR